MAYNGAGTFLINSTGQPVVATTIISDVTFNALTADLATGLSTAITKNGQTTPTANIPLGGFKITGLATGTAGTDATNVTQVAAAVAAVTTGYAPIASPTFTGIPAAPTATALTSTTQLATTAFATGAIAVAVAPLAPTANPTFTGTQTIITASPGDSTTQAASTAFATGAIATAVALLAPIASPTFTGVPAVPTATAGTNTTQAASTAFVTASFLKSGTQLSNYLTTNVSLTNASLYFTGPSVAQGTAGTWFASGSVLLTDTTPGSITYYVKLWDGTTVIASALAMSLGSGDIINVQLSGFLASPAGNIRISVQDLSSTAGIILFNSTGTSKDSSVFVFRVA